VSPFSWPDSGQMAQHVRFEDGVENGRRGELEFDVKPNVKARVNPIFLSRARNAVAASLSSFAALLRADGDRGVL
jgi:hypothetical protein